MLLQDFLVAGGAYLAGQYVVQVLLSSVTSQIESATSSVLSSRVTDILLVALVSAAIYMLIGMLLFKQSMVAGDMLRLVIAYILTALIDQNVIGLDSVLACASDSTLCNLGEMAIRSVIAGAIFVAIEPVSAKLIAAAK
jgi:hypothetical protein